MIKLFPIILLTSFTQAKLLPNSYEDNDVLEILVSELKSTTTAVPFDFYRLNWCNDKELKDHINTDSRLNLKGDYFLSQSPYLYKFNTTESNTICSKKLNQNDVDMFTFMSQHNYTYLLHLDDLPSAVVMQDQQDNHLHPNYFEGIPVGIYSAIDNLTMIYNHLDITVLIN